MPRTRQVIRKVERGEQADFDEQLWPVNCALVVLGGFVAGLIVASSDFADPRPLSNGWVRLASVGLLMLCLFLASLYFHRKRAVRRLQFAVLMSLLLHLWLGLGLHQFSLTAFTSRTQDAPDSRADEEDFVTLPDYGPAPSEEQAENDPLTAPVETATPETEVEAVARQETAVESAAAQVTSAPAEAPAAQPGSVPLERQETSAARRSEQSGQQLSRQTAPGREQPAESVPLPEVSPTRPSSDVSADARAVARRRQSETDAPPSASASQAPEAAERVERAEIARRANDAQPQSATDTATPQRATAAAETPESQQIAAESVTERSDAPQTAEARAAAVRADNVPEEAQAAAAPDAPSPTAVARSDAPRRERRAAPTPSQVAGEAPARRQSAAAAGDAQAQPGEVASAATASEPAMEATSTSSPRADSEVAAAAPSQSSAQPAAESTTAAAGAPSAATTQPRRGEASPTSPATTNGQVARRTRNAAATATTAEAIEGTTAAGAAAEAQTAEARPAAAGARRAGGAPSAGVASARADEAPSSGGASGPAAVARRSSSADRGAAGPTLPNSSPSLARTAAGVGAASGSAEAGAEQIAVGEAGGEASGETLEASGSAAASRQATGGPAGSATGEAGAAEDAPQPGAIASAAGRAATRDTEVGGAPAASSGIGRAQVAARDVPGEAVDGGAPAGATASAEGASLEGPSGEAGSTRGERSVAAAAPLGGGQGEEGVEAPRAGAARGAGGSPRRGEAAPQTGQIAAGTLGRSSASVAAPADGGEIAAAEVAVAGEIGAAGQPLEARGGGSSRQATQVAAAQPNGANGSELGPVTIGAAGETGSPRRADAAAAPAAADLAGQPLGRASSGVTPDLEATADELGPLAGAVATVAGGAEETLEGDASGSRAAASLPVTVAAEAGPGGLADEPTARVGVPDRRARPQSEVVQVSSGRFVLEKSAGGQTVDGAADPAPAFRQRMAAERSRRSQSQGGNEGSERAVEMGLDFLARHQSPDGHWSLHAFHEGRGAGYEDAAPGSMQADTAATGLALLSFLGAGYSHTDGKYRDVVEGGVAWLVAHQKEDGDLFSGGSKYVWLYSHGIAAIALCEAYGLTADPVLREPAQRALNFIAAAQHPTQGGWRYAPQVGTDTSVSGWQMMALKSGELAGLEVPSGCYEGVRGWLELAQGPAGNPARYAYRPSAENRHQREPSKAMTAEALLMRLYLGWSRFNPSLIDGADYLAAHLPEFGETAAPQRDAYYWYYATQVMFQMQGPHWEAWNGRLRPLLTETQVVEGPLAGSWDPHGRVADRWANEAGRVYVTAMHLLMLEVYYRHLPLYQTLEGE